MFAFDLMSGYHHVKIVKHHRRFLGFHWDNVYHSFTVFWVIICSICIHQVNETYSSLLAWYVKGLKAVVYLDDGSEG